MNIELYQWTIALAVVFLILEMIAGSFLFLGLALGTVPVVIAHYVTGEVSWGRDLSMFAIVSAASFMLMRRYFLKKNDTSSRSDDVNKY